MNAISMRAAKANAAIETVRRHFEGPYAKLRERRDACDLTFGNPHEMPLPSLVDALLRHAAPRRPDWFAYKGNEPEPRAFIASRLSSELRLPFEPDDIALTTGADGAIALALHLLMEPGDDAIVSRPCWFYEPRLALAGAATRYVDLQATDWALDIEAIRSAIGPRTRLVIVNTPHNPTGKIFDGTQLASLAEVMSEASARQRRRIYLLSDEPYRKLRFDNYDFSSPAEYYPWSVIAYSYGKVLLAPGQRLGYLAIGPMMPRAERRTIREAMFGAQVGLGWAFPNAIMQYAAPDLEDLSIDLAALSRKRDVVVQAIRAAGVDIAAPQGTFYVWAAAPKGDEARLWQALADEGIFVMPGSVLGKDGHFRICLTVSHETLGRAAAKIETVVRDLMRVC